MQLFSKCLHLIVAIAVTSGHVAVSSSKAFSAEPINIILINADDLGFGDLGCYGQKVIPTPSLDRMAREGMRFTQFYAGSTVCAPSRSVLMTGLHTGHTPVRGNGGKEQQTLPASSVTIAEVCKKHGYRTGLIGKWGLGEEETEGHPLNQGFDFFYGYLNQVHAHNHYPEFLWRNLQREPLPNVVQKPPQQPNSLGGMAKVKKVFANDRFIVETEAFLDENKSQPFFLYLALVLPHANNEARGMSGNGSESPNIGKFSDKPWDEPSRGFAAMVSDVDLAVGKVLAKLEQLGIDERTLVLFTSDNGPHQEAGHDLRLFNSSGGLRGTKRALYEGGIRVPLIARLPNKIAPNSISNHISYQADLLATISNVLGDTTQVETDGISFFPTLLGNREEQKEHAYLYWEFYEQGSRQAVRFGHWKAIREPMLTGDIQLFDLATDEKEQTDLAANQAELVKKAAEMMDQAHRSDPRWPVPQKNSAPQKKSSSQKKKQP
jgi:arylsulfatase A-like enzyme